MKSAFARSLTLLITASLAAASALAAAPLETLPSGVKVMHTVDGTGAQPKASDTVKVHYKGTLADGKEFDSSYKRNAPATFYDYEKENHLLHSLHYHAGGMGALHLWAQVY